MNIRETSCPFCTRSLADAFANRAPRLAPRTRLGRAATFAFGVLALTHPACSDDDDAGTPPQDAASIPPDAASTPPDAASTLPDAGMPLDAAYDGGDTPIYAAAPTRDAGPTSRG